MKRHTARIGVLLFALVGIPIGSDTIAASPSPQTDEKVGKQEQPAEPDPKTEAEKSRRVRWNALSVEQKKRLRRLAEKIRSLPVERRAALFERLGGLSRREVVELKRRVRAYQQKPERERRQLRERARRWRQIQRHLSANERRQLRRAEPEVRSRLLERHGRRLLEQFRRSMGPAMRRQFARLTRAEKIERFQRYLEQHSAQLRRDRREEQERQVQERRRRVQQIQNQLRRLPRAARRDLLENPRNSEVRVPDRLRRELQRLSPRERQRLKQPLRAPTRRRG